MNEQAIKDAHSEFVKGGYNGDINDFTSLISTNQEALSDAFDIFKSKGYGEDIEQFKVLMGVKKKEEGPPVQNQSQQPVATELPSVDSSSELPSPTGDRNKDILALGKGPLAQMPTAAESSIEEKVKEATKPQIKNLVISTKVMDLVGSGVKEKDAISSIAKEYELPEEDVKVTVDQLKPYQEEAYFSPDTDFGAALQMMRSGPMSNPVLSTVAEFIDDMGRSIGQGAKQAEGVRPSTDLMIDLGASDAETIKKFVQAGNELNKMAPSDEMVSFQNIVDMEGGGVWGLIKGLAKNPTVGPQVMASSLANMANSVSLAAAGSTIAAGAAAGAGGGIYGSVAGAAASLPYAMAAASSTLEAAMTFQELVGEELKKRGLEFDEEGVKKLLEDDEAMKVIRARSLARGATIGAIDAITGKVATRIAAKPRMSSLSRAAQVAKTAATESIGGSAGEAAGRLVAGQPMDVVEIGLEGLAEAPMSAVDIVSATFNKPVVTINGQKANETELNNILDKIESGAITVDEFKKMNITVNNDVTGYAKRINDIIQTDDIKKSVVQASPDIDEESLNKIVVLEKELLKLEGNKTQSAKDRRSQISNEIKTIQENAIQKPTTEEGVLRPEGPTVGLPKVGEGDQGKVAAEAGVPSAEAVRQVTDAELSGLMAYGGTMDMVNKIISQGISGKRSPQQVSEDVSNYLKGTNTYKTAPTDLMRESLLAKANELVLDQVKEQPKLTREEMMAESMGSPEIRAQVDESFKKTEGSKVTLENGEEATIKVEPLENNDIALVPEYTVSLIGKNGETVSSTVYNLDPKTGKIQRGAVSGAENFKFIEQTLSEGGMKKEGGAFVFEAKPAPEVAVEAEVELTPAKTEGEFEIVSGGKKLGQIKTEAVNDTDVKVSMVEVYEQKKGTATKAYAKLAEMLAAQGKKLVSDEARSEESEALWSSLERKGLAKKVGDTTTGMTFDYIYEYKAIAPAAAPTAQGVSMKDKIASNELASRTPDTVKAKIIRQSIKAVNTIKSLFPEFDIVVHENEESFNQAMERGKNASLRGAGGAMTRIKTPDGKVSVQVHINLDKASVNTVPHEVAHAVMLKAFGDDPQLFRTFRDRISKILSDDRVKQLNDFASQYSESESYEEFLVELAAVLATNKDKLNKATVSKILELINKVVSKITGGAFVPFKATAEATATNDLVDFFNSMSKSIAAGEAVEVTEKGKVKIAEGVVSKGRKQVEAYHGSPYDFERFTTEKIGTGEGAQAFGWGLYFTDVKSIAEHYKKALSGDVLSLDGKDYKLDKDGSNDDLRNDYPDIYYVRGLLGKSENVESAKKAILDYLSSNKQNLGNSFYETANRAIKSLESLGSFESKKSGKLYQVSLHQGKTPDQYTWLEWDKPIPDNVFNKIKNAIQNKYGNKLEDYDGKPILTFIDTPSMRGGAIMYKTLSRALGGDKKASLFLLDAGIDGVKYPAESISRGATSETARGSNYVVFDENAITIVTKGRKAEELSEANMPGYDATMEKVGGIIAKVIDRVRNEPDRDAAMRRAFDDVLGYLQGSDLYTKATDTQREQLVRDVRNRFYMKEKPAPSVGRILGTIKNVKKVTLSEKDALKNQLRAEARGAKNAAAAIKSATQSLAKELNDMVGAGKITAKQLTSIMNRFSKVKVLDETSVSNFVDYMANVFEDAEYMDKISKIKNILPTAKKNMMTKLGMGENLVPNLQKIFNINPTFIPAEVFNKYMGLVEMIGKRQAVLELSEISDVIKTSDEIMSAIDQKLSLIDELADRFNSSENKVFNEDGTIDYAKTIEKMVEAGEASVEELELMRANKSKIYSTSKGPNEGYIYNRVNELLDEGESISGAIGQVAEELGIETSVVGEVVDNKTKEKADLIETVKSMADDMATDRFDTEDERNDARRLKKLLTTDAVNSMSISDLNNIVKMIDNINNGYISNFSKIMSEKLESVIAGKDVAVSVEKAKPMPISKIIGKAKTLLTGSQNFFDEIIKRGVLYYIDQSLGDFKTKRVFNAIFERASEAMSRYEYELNRISDVLDTAQERVAKSHGMDHNKTLKAKYKMMAYMLQLEYDSNKGAKVNPAMAVLKETVKFIESKTTMYSQNDVEIINEIMKQYKNDKGQIDAKRLYDSFNESEKDAIRTMQQVNKSLRGKAIYTSSVIRGDRIRPLDNYIHHSVMYEDNEASRMKDVTSPSRIGESMKPSTKAKSLISRTGAVMPLNLDPFAAVHKGSKAVLMDYYLTSPIRTARRAFNQARTQMKRDGAYTSDSRKIIDAIENAFETTLEDTLTKSFSQNSLVNSALDFISKQGYRAVLASVTRSISELASNIGFAVWVEPEAMITGWKNRSVLMSENAPTIMFNLKSKQTNRIYPSDSLSGRLIDPNIINQVSGIKSGKAKSAVANKLNQIHNLTTKKYMNVVELTADALISTPDKMVMRPIWFGSFINEFKKITGVDPDMDKIAQNDENYMSAYSEALEAARNVADESSVRAASSNNAFMASIKGKNIKGDGMKGAIKIAWNNFNNFMTTFLMYEYITARTGVMAAVGNGVVSKKKGAAMLAGVTTRMMVYGMLGTTLANVLASAITGSDDDEEQDKKSFMQSLGQQFASAFTSLMFGRDFGQAARTVINYGVEQANEEYMDFLREGEYDPYKDAIQYTMLPSDKKKVDLGDMILKMGGSYGPALTTANLIVESLGEEEKKKKDAKQRQADEMYIRIPLQAAGAAGLVPLYKDVDRIVKKEIYKSIEEAEKISQKRKKAEEASLGGYRNKEEMKEKDPEMYQMKYGPNSVNYQLEKVKKDLEKRKKRIKDRL